MGALFFRFLCTYSIQGIFELFKTVVDGNTFPLNRMARQPWGNRSSQVTK